MVNIENKADCTGCHSCMTVCPRRCITMASDKQGFKYPIVNADDCINCKLCDKVCHMKRDDLRSKPYKAYAAKNNNENERMSSSSGGIFVAVAKWVIGKGGSVYGAAFDEKFRVHHVRVTKEEDLEQLQTSKYVQSDIENTYIQAIADLEDDKYVLFTGTPCQIGGLKSFLNKEYDKLILQDIMCHGVPSPKLWSKYIKELGIGEIKKICFRDKSDGWSEYHVKIEGTKKNIYDVFNKNTYMRAFIADASLRPSCYNCRYKHLDYAGDYILADFWGVSSICPEMNDNKGVSLFLVNSTKGERLFDVIKGQVEFKEVDLNSALSKNGAAINGAAMNEKNKALFEHIDDMTVHGIVEKYIRGSLWNRVKNKLLR
ncbi:Coenzyme F420 hydrogenase/dehydrogenase, beta subunit C-terminal domain [Butyrivibrio sp. JL13D10]|uniref:Coenzyme F420 hydrogenase/dehydrogenase, beta subunit C-terminal domain n=1 Tax=Butyrivibrio sp. JL13D10 TaxID=3236815 RepID=UPI0038B55CC6